MAEIIKTDGMRQPVQPANGTDFTLEEMQAIVGGDIELVFLNETEIMVVNEEGKINDLAYNPAATFSKETTREHQTILSEMCSCAMTNKSSSYG